MHLTHKIDAMQAMYHIIKSVHCPSRQYSQAQCEATPSVKATARPFVATSRPALAPCPCPCFPCPCSPCPCSPCPSPLRRLSPRCRSVELTAATQMHRGPSPLQVRVGMVPAGMNNTQPVGVEVWAHQGCQHGLHELGGMCTKCLAYSSWRGLVMAVLMGVL